LRPRDFLLEALKIITSIIGSNEMLAVSENGRYHHHPYFNKKIKKPGINYDEIWSERGFLRINDDFFKFNAEAVRRDIETIKPNKRSMYRKRFELIDNIELRLRQDISLISPIEMPDS
jgi:uncharacterized protein VirK/YbjX